MNLLTLSTAIRLGAMMHPQCFDAAWERDVNHRVIATCAIGAAWVAGWHDTSSRSWTAVDRRIVTCPACTIKDFVRALVTHLNDSHRWTREAIADFVEFYETQEGLKRADAGYTDVPAARSSTPSGVDADDREKGVASLCSGS